jgi:hypothetical protein
VVGVDFFRKKNIAGWLLLVGLFKWKSTPDW